MARSSALFRLTMTLIKFELLSNHTPIPQKVFSEKCELGKIYILFGCSTRYMAND